MSEKPWIDYRLTSLELWNGGIVNFNGAEMWYNKTEYAVAIQPRAMSFAQLQRAFLDAGGTLDRSGRPTSAPAIKTINYDMDPDGYPLLGFYHDIQEGAGVVLMPPTPPDGQTLFIMQRNERSIYSKNYTLNEVSRGTIPSERAVWQFHGYKHEH